jgi:hypothetical protein
MERSEIRDKTFHAECGEGPYIGWAVQVGCPRITLRSIRATARERHTSCASISSKAAIETHQTPVRSHGRSTIAMAA